jgi:Resolvase, N terminal domain
MTRISIGDGALRVAFYGRVACDGDGTAATAIARQYEQCRRALPPGAITAVFYDIGSHPGVRRRPGQLRLDGLTLRRDGGLNDLLAEAGRPSRRFDQIVTYGPDRLSRDMRRAWELLNRLAVAGVECLFPFGTTVEPARTSLPMMRLVAAVCTTMWGRAAEDGEPR